MAIRVDITRASFYNELPQEKRNEYFNCTWHKYLPEIDNIYYSLILQDDKNDNTKLKPLLYKLETLKEACLKTHVEQSFEYGLNMTSMGFSIYKYCLREPDLYDIFISNYLPNDDTPRVLIQLRAHGLWLYGAEKMLTDSYRHVEKIFEEYGCVINSCRENRIDFCYHTNAISNPEKIFADKNINKQMKTTMELWHQTGRIQRLDGNILLRKDYFALGQRSSNNVFIRFYNKALEVIEMGYKGFFFEIWKQNGLISFYDKYCFDYAIDFKNYAYVHKAKLYFYIEYGTNCSLKEVYQKAINNPNTTLAECEELAKAYMPEVTTVMNIEFETKRKFYYSSDKMIDSILQYIYREDIPAPLRRIYKIIDNRHVFLDYLTETTVCFKKPDGNFVAWWERLRNTKGRNFHDTDAKLVRDYSFYLDERLAKVKFINAVATNAVYQDNVGTDFISDISDVLSNLNDNNAQKLNFSLYKCTDDGEIIENFNPTLLNTYQTKKIQKEKRLKNRKKIDKQISQS